jgi:hypothetical protein
MAFQLIDALQSRLTEWSIPGNRTDDKIEILLTKALPKDHKNLEWIRTDWKGIFDVSSKVVLTVQIDGAFETGVIMTIPSLVSWDNLSQLGLDLINSVDDGVILPDPQGWVYIMTTIPGELIFEKLKKEEFLGLVKRMAFQLGFIQNIIVS